MFCASLRRVAIGLAQPRHLDALFLAFAASPGAGRGPGGGAFASGGRRFRLRRLGPGLAGAPVFCASAAAITSSLVSRPSLPVPLDLRRIDMMFEHRAAHRRGQGRDVILVVLPAATSGSATGACSSPRSAGVSPGAGGIGRRRGCRCAPEPRQPPSPLSSIRAITAPTATVSPSLDQLLGQHSGDRRRHFDADLVGLEAGDRLVRRDRFARLLEPLGKRSFGDRFPERGDLDVRGHVLSLFRGDAPSASALAAMAERGGDQGRLLGGVALGKAGRGRRAGVAAGILRAHALEARLRQALLEQCPRRSSRRRCSSALPAPRPAPPAWASPSAA